MAKSLFFTAVLLILFVAFSLFTPADTMTEILSVLVLIAAAWGLLDHMLMEVSPCFAAYYPDLLVKLIAAGFRVYLLPPKRQPPHVIDEPERDLAPFRLDTLGTEKLRETVANWQQEDVWLRRENASW